MTARLHSKRDLNPATIDQSLFADRRMTERTLHGCIHDELEHAVPVHNIAENPVEGDLCGLATGFAA